jgi:hypothetical protein
VPGIVAVAAKASSMKGNPIALTRVAVDLALDEAALREYFDLPAASIQRVAPDPTVGSEHARRLTPAQRGPGLLRLPFHPRRLMGGRSHEMRDAPSVLLVGLGEIGHLHLQLREKVQQLGFRLRGKPGSFLNLFLNLLNVLLNHKI